MNACSPSPLPRDFGTLGRARAEIGFLEAKGALTATEASRLRDAVAQEEASLLTEGEPHAADDLVRLVERSAPHLLDPLSRAYAQHDARDDAQHTTPSAAPAETPVERPKETPAEPPADTLAEAPLETTNPATPGIAPTSEAPDRWRMRRFLESMNIHWGLLTGALLIVGCSIALIVTLWRSESFLIRYATFVGVTVGLCLAGRFAWQRLGLRSTGAAVVTVAMLLMPLGLLAADFTAPDRVEHVPWELRIGLWVGYTALAWVAFRGLLIGATTTFGLTFSVLLFAQLLARALPLDTWWLAIWGVTGAYLVAMKVIASSAARAERATPYAIAAGILAFCYVLLPIRLAIETPLGHTHTGAFAALAAAGLLMVTRQMRTATFATVVHGALHLAIPASLTLAWTREPGPMLWTAGTISVIYGIIAWADRSRTALLAGGATAFIAGAAAIVLRHATPFATLPWLPAPIPTLAFDLAVVAMVALALGESLRRTWAGTTLCPLALAVLAFASLGCALETPVTIRLVALLGVGGAAGFLWTRRNAYAYAAFAALPIVLALEPAHLGWTRAATELALGAIALGYAGLAVATAWRSAVTPTASVLHHTAVAVGAFALYFSLRPDVSSTSPFPSLLASAAWLLLAIRGRSHPLGLAGGLAFAFAVWFGMERWIGPITVPTIPHVLTVMAAGALALAISFLRSAFVRAHAIGLSVGLFATAMIVGWWTPASTGVGLAMTAIAGFGLALTWRARFGAAPAVVTALAIPSACTVWFHLLDPIEGFGLRLVTASTVTLAPRWIAAVPIVAAFVLTALARWCGRPARAVFSGATLLHVGAGSALLLLDPDPRKVWILGSVTLLAWIAFRRMVIDTAPLRVATLATGLLIAAGAVFDAVPSMPERYGLGALAAVITGAVFAWPVHGARTYRIGLHVITAGVSLVALAAALDHHDQQLVQIAWPGFVACALGVAALAHVRVGQHHAGPAATIAVAMPLGALLVWSTVLLGVWSLAWLPVGFVAAGFAWQAWQRLDRNRTGRAVALAHFTIAALLTASAPTEPGSLAAGYLATLLAIVGRAPAAIAALATVTAFAQLNAVVPLFPWPASGAALIGYAGLAVGLVWLWEACHRVVGSAAFRLAALGASFVALGFVGQAGWVLDLEGDVLPRALGVVFAAAVAVFYLACAIRDRLERYAYLAQGAMVGVFAYVRFTHPWLFNHEWAQRLWPITLVGIGFGAIAVAAWSGRRDRYAMLARPFSTVGLWLPAVSLVGVWFTPALDHLTVGTIGLAAAFYALTAWSRGNIPLAYISVAAANLAVLTFAYVLDLDPLVYPEAFLAPVGSSLIAIAHWRRHALSRPALQALRTIGTAIIYASLATALFADDAHRTTEMLVLAGLSVLGIVTGIGYRVRAFLYAGTGFLLFDVAYMIFRAGREDTWIWWVSGITLGVLVMFGFALAERYRDRMQRAIRELRAWA